jgi:endonuclease-8
MSRASKPASITLNVAAASMMRVGARDHRRIRRAVDVEAVWRDDRLHEWKPVPQCIGPPSNPNVPEGHTLHRAAAEQQALLAGHVVAADSPQGRFDEGAALVDGRRLTGVEAWGKHLFYVFEGDAYVHVHLGLFGRFRSGSGAAPEVRGAVRLRLRSATAWATVNGPTVCEILDEAGRRRVLARLGPDPLRPASRPAAAFARIARSAIAVGALLMDQSVVAGIGNVYRAELLFRAGIDPFRAGSTLARAEFARVWRDARGVMRDGVRDRRMVTTRPADRPHPTGAVRRGERFYVYHRTGKPCFVCGTPIRQAPMAGRTVYWCPVCQR